MENSRIYLRQYMEIFHLLTLFGGAVGRNQRRSQMKKFFLGALGIGLFWGMISLANAEIYRGVDFPEGAVSFADEWILYEPTAGVMPPYNDPSSALGVPDTPSGAENAVSLGDQGVLVLKFVDNSLTTSWDNRFDLWIFEVGSDIEPTSVDISINGLDWINVGNTNGGTSGIDIDAFLSSGVILGEKYSYVRLTDLLPHQSGSPYEGADIDAVGAISSTSPVPIPGAVWLLGSGFVGLIGLKYKKNKSA